MFVSAGNPRLRFFAVLSARYREKVRGANDGNTAICGGKKMAEMSPTITSKGQVTIPKPIRERMGVGPHDRVSSIVEGDAVNGTD
jgi:AbrB family looped-hinge helix DNA binding protein